MMLSHLPSWAVELNSYPESNPPSPTYPTTTINFNSRTLHSNLFVKCHTFKLPTEKAASDMHIGITDCQYIGSYNWVSDHEEDSIIVPGSPREWQEQPLPCTVPPDILGHYREQYDRRMSATPLLPLLLSVNHWYERTHAQPSKFPWHSVDFVTNRNSLRHLLRILRRDNCGSNGTGGHGGKDYSRGSFTNPYSKPFRIDIELAGTKTILLNRWEPTDSEPLFINSYGYNFENAFTREADAVSSIDESGESARHHRINSYDFGGLKMVVRSEIDACIPAADSLLDTDSDEGFPDADSTTFIPALPPQLSPGPTSTKFGLKIIPSLNPPTPQSHLIELSTTKLSNFSTWNAKERYPQLYFSQVPNHYLASHVNGTITQINKRDLHKSPEILFYAPIVEPKLRMLRKLLEMIQGEVVTQYRRSRGTRKSFSLVYINGRLKLFERVGDRCLPDEAFAIRVWDSDLDALGLEAVALSESYTVSWHPHQLFSFATSKMFDAAHHFVIKGANFFLGPKAIEKGAGLRYLLDKAMRNAFHDSSTRWPPPRCHENTRIELLNILYDRELHSSDYNESILWLDGPFGVGKTALAQTFAEYLSFKNKLIASLFFSRSNDLKDAVNIIPSIAYQLAMQFPDYGELLDCIVQDNPSLVTSSFPNQFRSLIVEPLRQIQPNDGTLIRGWIILDGLDEIQDKKHQMAIARLIATSVKDKTTPFLWFITSRPENYFIDLVTDPRFSPSLFQLSVFPSPEGDPDIHLYLKVQLENIRNSNKLPPSWPSEGDIEALEGFTEGLWVCTASLVQFIGDPHSIRGPRAQLDLVLSLIKDHSHAPNHPLATMTKLYMMIMKDIPPQTMSQVQEILLLNRVYSDHSVNKVIEIANMLELSEQEFRKACSFLHSVLYLETANSLPTEVKFYHSSFMDFLEDPGASEGFYLYGACLEGLQHRITTRLNRIHSSEGDLLDALKPSFPLTIHRNSAEDLALTYHSLINSLLKLCDSDKCAITPSIAGALRQFQFTKIPLFLHRLKSRYRDASLHLNRFQNNLPPEFRNKMLHVVWNPLDYFPRPSCAVFGRLPMKLGGQCRLVVWPSSEKTIGDHLVLAVAECGFYDPSYAAICFGIYRPFTYLFLLLTHYLFGYRNFYKSVIELFTCGMAAVLDHLPRWCIRVLCVFILLNWLFVFQLFQSPECPVLRPIFGALQSIISFYSAMGVIPLYLTACCASALALDTEDIHTSINPDMLFRLYFNSTVAVSIFSAGAFFTPRPSLLLNIHIFACAVLAIPCILKLPNPSHIPVSLRSVWDIERDKSDSEKEDTTISAESDVAGRDFGNKYILLMDGNHLDWFTWIAMASLAFQCLGRTYLAAFRLSWDWVAVLMNHSTTSTRMCEKEEKQPHRQTCELAQPQVPHREAFLKHTKTHPRKFPSSLISHLSSHHSESIGCVHLRIPAADPKSNLRTNAPQHQFAASSCIMDHALIRLSWPVAKSTEYFVVHNPRNQSVAFISHLYGRYL
ncbi:hypothetical protein NP233_g10056 [Leucocoprinus birnbaumii]|uniref:NACHT domain-containing protein n=1 Tax=Leucocoprinus birnbaumii TaxID=56174 RepID=A0AAD5VJ97_9AGAR|nr:hypothetical protein NP233_g10056 [Leucocoprinus birnbaumii]